MTDRRGFLRCVGLAAVFPAIQPRGWLPREREPVLRPPRLQQGDLVALVSPAGATAESVSVEVARETLQALGLRVRLGAYAQARYGYLAGRDSERAHDLNRMFADPEVKGIIALRGGWGAARILPLLDYEAIRRNPKVLVGYSDITALLNAIHARTGLVTFHGPVGISSWDPFAVEHFRGILFDARAPTLGNPAKDPAALVQREHRVQVITPGTARGRLLGGNLSVLTALLGSPYVPDWNGAILFLEEVGEDIYRVDRMLTHLKLTGVLDRVAGVVFGRCVDCEPGEGYGSLTLEQLFQDHLAPLLVPAWYGAMIGHIRQQWTVPVGLEVEVDATSGTVRMLEPAVV